jgi:hypothetical protein
MAEVKINLDKLQRNSFQVAASDKDKTPFRVVR